MCDSRQNSLGDKIKYEILKYASFMYFEMNPLERTRIVFRISLWKAGEKKKKKSRCRIKTFHVRTVYF